MLQSDKVRSSEAGQRKLRQAIKDAGLTQEKLKDKASVSVDTVKRLLGTKPCPNGVERWAVKNIAEVLGIAPTDIVDSKDWDSLPELPEEFAALIKDKIETFCGRQFIFKEFAEFCNDNPCGYFTVVGDAGTGKTAIAAKYVSQHYVPCYFNILAEGRNRPELFLRSIRQQLSDRYSLADVQQADLPSLLAQASRKLSGNESLVIVVDALDEVSQEPGDNLLYLPTTLPERVYFLLTRRPYNLEKKRLTVSPGLPVKELDVAASEYFDFSRADVKTYINLWLDPAANLPSAKDRKNAKAVLKRWIEQRQIAPEEFAEQVAQKSENNFMYLRYVLPAIARGFYDDLTLKQLPDGLQEYYQTHWTRMGMEKYKDKSPTKLMVLVLFVLVEIGTPITKEIITGVARAEDSEVDEVLAEWVEYLKEQHIEAELCYSIYHASFLDFLKAKRELKPTRSLFREANERIVAYLEKEIDLDGI